MAVAITQTANPAGVAASANVATYTGVSIGAVVGGRIVVLVVGAELASASPNSATIDIGSGDVAMTAGTLANQGAVYAQTFYYTAHTGTTATFKITFGATPNDTQNHVAVYSVTGGVFNASNGVADTDADPISTGSVTILTNGGMIAICSDAATTARTWTGLTEDIDADTTAFRFSTGTIATGGMVTTTVSGGNAEDGAISWLTFKPRGLIQAAAGSFALTGTDASLEHGWKIAADVGGYALTGTDATLSKGQKIVVDAGSFALTGTDAALREARKAIAGEGVYSLAGVDASLEAGWRVGADTGSFALTGTDATLTLGEAVLSIIAEPGSYSLTGTDAEVRVDRRVVAEIGSFVLTGTDASLEYGWTIAAGIGEYALTGTVVSLNKGKFIAAGNGSFLLTGTAASLKLARHIAADFSSFNLTGTAATLTNSGAGGVIDIPQDGGLGGMGQMMGGGM